ncbi:MAG: hypothetical protein AVDCRST_MAG49-4265 [uncultured Thermomicrobiales bacterium]|uniref:Uncharacterized protein n=1 Tax=uncultured Thermomicrobiales bacterium TaxID=1645740 RepID=A0A6J4VE63_9BACT|nr:MAG: hypothetical protein AVDCRST_MAG49-4265 [uncultured Thermomicrobiales bacterium]
MSSEPRFGDRAAGNGPVLNGARRRPGGSLTASVLPATVAAIQRATIPNK